MVSTVDSFREPKSWKIDFFKVDIFDIRSRSPDKSFSPISYIPFYSARRVLSRVRVRVRVLGFIKLLDWFVSAYKDLWVYFLFDHNLVGYPLGPWYTPYCFKTIPRVPYGSRQQFVRNNFWQPYYSNELSTDSIHIIPNESVVPEKLPSYEESIVNNAERKHQKEASENLSKEKIVI